MASGAADLLSSNPVTLLQVMQSMIGAQLKEHYEAPQKLSHQLLVLLMQLNEQQRKANHKPKEGGQAKRSPAKRPGSDKSASARRALSAGRVTKAAHS
jgi:hypothetical protein